jgi:hypothetical protein
LCRSRQRLDASSARTGTCVKAHGNFPTSSHVDFSLSLPRLRAWALRRPMSLCFGCAPRLWGPRAADDEGASLATEIHPLTLHPDELYTRRRIEYCADKNFGNTFFPKCGGDLTQLNLLMAILPPALYTQSIIPQGPKKR